MKKIVSFSVCICILCMIILNANIIIVNAQNHYTDKYIKVSPEYAINNEIQKWISSIYDNNAIVTDCKPVYSCSSFDGYICTFEKESIPCGYVVFKYNTKEKVFYASEFSITTGDVGIYNSIVEKSTQRLGNEKIKRFGKWMYEIEPFEYIVPYLDYNDKERFTVIHEDTIEELRDLERNDLYYSYNNHSDIYISSTDFNNSNKYYIQSKFYINNRKRNTKAYSFDCIGKDFTKVTKSYSCGIVAILNVLFNYKLINNDQDTVVKHYRKIFEMANIEDVNYIDTLNGRVAECGLQYNEIKRLLKNHIKNGFPKKQLNVYEPNSKFSSTWAKEQIWLDRPVVMTYYLCVNGKTIGHCITIVGWFKVQKVNKNKEPYGKSYEYFAVNTGWENTARFLNYTDVDFMETPKAFSVKISNK